MTFYGKRMFLFWGHSPPLCYHPRLAAICSPNISWLCSLPSGALQLQKGWEVPPLVKQAVTSAVFQAEKPHYLGLLPFSGQLLHLLSCYAESGKHNQTEGKGSKIMCVCRHQNGLEFLIQAHNLFFEARY